MVPAAPYPPLQKTQGRGTQSSERGRESDFKRLGHPARGYPPDLEILVNGVEAQAGKRIRFLRSVPTDPMTKSKDWGLHSMQDDPDSDSWGGQAVFDVYTKSRGPDLTERNTKIGNPKSCRFLLLFSLLNCRRFCSCESTRLQQRSTDFNERAAKASISISYNNKIQQISISVGIWFGTRGSEVQILSPRPILSSS